jgi:G3E family GTPase
VRQKTRIPVTVLTGFLGSGKTTLLNRILNENHGLRIAVIENELGEVGVDQALVVNADEEIFELSNGCICCRVRGDLIRILSSLLQRRDRLDRVVIETTGLANPGPVAQTFFIDPELQDEFQLDGIVTLVDAKHVLLHLDTSSECQEQIAFADVLILNKIDLVDTVELHSLKSRIRQLNPVAQIHLAERAELNLESVLRVGGFDLSRALEAKPVFLEPEYPFEWTGIFLLESGRAHIEIEGSADPSVDLVIVEVSSDQLEHLQLAAERSVRVLANPAASADAELAPDTFVRVPLCRRSCIDVVVAEKGLYAVSTEHLPEEVDFTCRSASGELLRPLTEHRWKPAHVHEEQVGAIGLETERLVNRETFETWLGELLRIRGPQLYRTKGVLCTTGSERRWVFQSVHMLLESALEREWRPDEARRSRLVFIGKGLDEAELRSGLEACLQ